MSNFSFSSYLHLKNGCNNRCQSLDELVGPLRSHLAPRLSDHLILGIVGGASKRLEGAIKRVSLFKNFSSYKQLSIPFLNKIF